MRNSAPSSPYRLLDIFRMRHSRLIRLINCARAECAERVFVRQRRMPCRTRIKFINTYACKRPLCIEHTHVFISIMLRQTRLLSLSLSPEQSRKAVKGLWAPVIGNDDVDDVGKSDVSEACKGAPLRRCALPIIYASAAATTMCAIYAPTNYTRSRSRLRSSYL